MIRKASCSHVDILSLSPGAKGLSELAHGDNRQSSLHGINPVIRGLREVEHNGKPVVEEAVVQELK